VLVCHGISQPLGVPVTYTIDEVLLERRKIEIFCNDCEKRSRAFFHVYGVECTFCEGYNTCKV
jgi:hypothetical protein